MQLITGLRIAEMSQLQNKIVVSCVQRMGVIVKMKKKKREKVRGRGDVYKEWKLL